MQSKQSAIYFIIGIVGLFIILLLSALYFPFGPHIDQITPFLVPQLISQNIVSVDLRTIIASWIAGGYFFESFLTAFQQGNSFAAIDILLKLPSLLYFFGALIIWFDIIRKVATTVIQKYIFILMLITAPFIVFYAGFLGSVGAYFFFISIITWALLYLFESKKNIHIIIWASIILIAGLLSLLTHIISAVLVPVILLSFLVFYPHEDISKKRNILNRSIILIMVVVIGIVGYWSIFLVDSEPLALRRQYSTVTSYLQRGEIGLFIGKAMERVFYHSDVRFIALGDPQFTNVDPKETFKEYVNPEDSVWLLNGIGPWGFLGLLSYAVPAIILFLEFKSKKLRALLISQLLGFLAVVPISSYDNPSIVRIIPVLMWIPLGYIAIMQWAEYKKARFKYIAIGAIVLLTIISGGYSLYKVFSQDFTESQSKKFQVGIAELATQIATVEDKSRLRIYINSETFAIERYLGIYFGTSITNRIVHYETTQLLKERLPNAKESAVIISEVKDDFKDLTLSPNQYGRYFFGKYPTSSTPISELFATNNTLCRNEVSRVTRAIEFDTLAKNNILFESAFGSWILPENTLCSFTQIDLKNVDSALRRSDSVLIRTPMGISSFNIGENIVDRVILTPQGQAKKINDLKYELMEDTKSSSLLVVLPPTETNTSLLEMDVSVITGGAPYISVYDITAELSRSITRLGKTKFYAIDIPKGHRSVVTVYNSNSPTPSVIEVSVGSYFAVEDTALQQGFLQRNSLPAESLFTISGTKTDKGFSIKGNCEDTVLVFNKPFSYYTLTINGVRQTKDQVLVNGFVNGWQLSEKAFCGDLNIEVN